MSIQRSQLKIQILAGLTALLLIVPICNDMVHGFILGFNSPEMISYEALPIGVEIVPTDNNHINTIDSNCGELTVSDIKRKTMLFIPSQSTSTAVTVACGIISVVAIFFALYYIISVIKMASVNVRQGIMNNVALKQLRKVSYSMLSAYILFTLSSFLPTWYYNNHLTLDGYTITHPDINENFVIAITLILLTEILKIALHLKEEQDLTI